MLNKTKTKRRNHVFVSRILRMKSAIALSKKALPYYTILPLIAILLHFAMPEKRSIENFHFLQTLSYLALVELMVFLDHYYILHKWKHLSHNVHHQFKYEVSAWVAFAFHPWDGLSQGMPILYAALLIPVPWAVVYGMIVLVGIWTIYIHTDILYLPYPFMGSDYHLIHHQKNWYNFGLFTVFFDTLWGTLKHLDKE